MKRQLDWYRLCGQPVHVYIGSSTVNHIALEQTWLRGVDCGGYGGSNVDITYIHFSGELSGAHEMEAAYQMARRVKEPYTFFCGDDDFAVPETLDELISVFDRGGVGAVYGRMILFKLWNDGVYGELEAADEYPDELFRLYRTEILVEALDHCRKLPDSSQRGRDCKAQLDQYRHIQDRTVIHAYRQMHPYRVTSVKEDPSWRTRLGRRYRGLVKLNQWLNSFDDEQLNLTRLRRHSLQWGFDRFERFITNGQQ
jgi:hypothetical protein